MSAIAGIFNRNNGPVDGQDLTKMIDTLSHRGPDGANMWQEGSIALGHRMLWTTPESCLESLPMVNSTRDLAITADARIDNRAELITKLDLKQVKSLEISDSQLILAAYEKWREGCIEHLIGAFAFAIWDRGAQRLFCARDHMGINAFYYHLTDHTFVFASEIKAILCLPDVPRRLNETRIADHLGMIFADKDSTFYQDIVRLPPASYLIVEPDHHSVMNYWSPDPHTELRLSSDDEYAEAFREIFEEAVRCRLRSAFPIGSTVGGGLDSSAITCVARNILQPTNQTLHTISFAFDDDAPCNEMSFTQAVLAQGGMTPTFTRGDQYGPLTHISDYLQCTDEPYHGANMFQSRILFEAAQKQGIRILFDGLDGDTTVSHGWSYLTELARTSRWADFATEIKAASDKDSDLSLGTMFRQYGLPSFKEKGRKGQLFSFTQDSRQIAKYFNIPIWRLLYYGGLRHSLSSHLRPIRDRFREQPIRYGYIDKLIAKVFAQRTNISDRLLRFSDQYQPLPTTEREAHWREITTGLIPHLLEKTHALAAPFSLELRHPFMDKRLIEFCLSLPAEQKRNQGWGRLVMRRAMDNILPEAVQWRADKANFEDNFALGMLKYDRACLETVIDAQNANVKPYINHNYLQHLYRGLDSGANDMQLSAMVLWLVVTLERWLSQENQA